MSLRILLILGSVNSPPEEVLSFLTNINQRTNQLTKRTRYSQLISFFNFITQNLDPNFRSPCDTPMLKKLYRPPGPIRWTILEKGVVDEIIFRTIKPRNRLILELMARGGMRIGEVLKLTPNDIENRKLTLRAPKSGKEREIVFIPQKIADRPKCICSKRLRYEEQINSWIRSSFEILHEGEIFENYQEGV